MWLAVLCGLAIGVILNLGADWYSVPPSVGRGWLPRHAAPLGEDDTPSRHLLGERRRLARWGALLLVSVGLLLHLRGRWYTPVGSLPPRANGVPLLGGSAPTRQWLAGAVPEVTYCSLLLLIATIDLEHRLVPNVLILSGLLLAMGFSLLAHSPSLTTLLAGAAAGGGLFLLPALARPNAMGAGDVKLAFLIGMLTGFPWVLQALVLGILLGGLGAALLLLFRVRGPKQYIPYAPYLAAGGIATLLYGQQIAQWYARLLDAVAGG